MLPIQRKGRGRNLAVEPFPHDNSVAYFTGADVEVFDENAIKTLTNSGCYGLNPKPRQATTFNQQQKMKSITEAEYKMRLGWQDKFGSSMDDTSEMLLVGDKVLPDPFHIPHSLVLFLEEAFFLHHSINCLEIRDLEDAPISTEELWTKFCNIKESFVECYVAYLYLKSRNWGIKSGMKFGGEFVLYKHGPQSFHATFIVIVTRTGQKSSYEYHTNERIAETTGKNLLYLEIHFPDDVPGSEYLANLDKFQAKEIMIQRHVMIAEINKAKV